VVNWQNIPKDIARFWLAWFIIILTVGSVWIILTMSSETTTIITTDTTGANTTTTAIIGPTFDQKIEAVKTLLAVFGVWVGTVIAFYYSSESMRTAQEGILTALTPQQRLLSLKAGDTMETPVIAVTPDTSVAEAIRTMDGENLIKTEISKLVVTDQYMKPLGILYYWELLKALPAVELAVEEKIATKVQEAEQAREAAKTLTGDEKVLKDDEVAALEQEAQTLRDELSQQLYPISSIMAQVESSWKRAEANGSYVDRGNYVKAQVDTSLAAVKMALEADDDDYAIIVNALEACLGILTKKRLLEKSMM